MRATLPAPPHWAASRAPGCITSKRCRKSAAWSGIQWNVAPEKTASTGASIGNGRCRSASMIVTRSPNAARFTRASASIDGDASTATTRPRGTRSRIVAVTRPLPQPASSTVSSPASSSRSRIGAAHRNCGAASSVYAEASQSRGCSGSVMRPTLPIRARSGSDNSVHARNPADSRPESAHERSEALLTTRQVTCAVRGERGVQVRMTDKRMSEEDVVAELSDGMTIGIGGWGSRRKPMSIVRAILRSDLKDLTVVSYGGPDVGMLCAAGKVRKAVYGFVSLDSIPLEPHFRNARQNGTIEAMELDEGMLQWGLRAAAMRVSFLPCRAGLGSAIMDNNPSFRTVVSPYDDGEEYLAMPALPLDVALLHANRADARGDAQYLGNDWYFDDLFCMAAQRTFVSCERVVEPSGFLEEGPPSSIRVDAHLHRRRHRGTPRRALHALHPRLRARRGVPAGVRGDRPRTPTRGRRSGPSTSTSPKPTTAA